jgi:hypothetical protein
LILVTDPTDPSADLPKILTANALPIDLPETMAKFVEIKAAASRLDFANEEVIPLQIDFKAQAALRAFEYSLRKGYSPPKIFKEAAHHPDYVSILDERKSVPNNGNGYKYDVVAALNPKHRVHSVLYQCSTDAFCLATENSCGGSQYWPACEPSFNLDPIIKGDVPFKNHYFFNDCGSYLDYNIAQNYIQYWPSMLDANIRSELMSIVERTLKTRGLSIFTKDDFAKILSVPSNSEF